MSTRPGQGLGRSPFRRELGELVLVTGGKFASLASLILCNVLVARWTSDTGEYGRYATGISLVLILDAAVGVPLDLSVVRFAEVHSGEPLRVNRLHAAALRLKLLLGMALLAVAATWGGVLSPAVLGDGASPALLMTVLLATVALLLVRSTAVRLQAGGQFARYAALDGFQGAFRLAAISAALALGYRSAESLLGAYVVGTALTFAAGCWAFPGTSLRDGWPGRRDLRESAVHAALTAGIVVCGTLTGRSDIPIVASVRSAEDAGYYAVAVQVAGLLTMLASYYSVVMQPRVIHLSRAGQLATSLRWNVAWAATVSLATAALAAWVLPAAIPGFFGARYAPAVPIAQVLLVGTCIDLFSMPLAMVFSIQGFPIPSLVGEAAIAIGFFGVAFSGSISSMMAMAWLVTGVRGAKLLVYLGITVADLRRTDAKRP